MQTSDADIYAAGDVVETAHRLSNERTAVPLGGPANRQGRVAADHIFLGEKARPYPGSLGTAIVRVFGTTAGTVGWSENALEKNGRSYGMVTVNDFHHAGYYPGAKPLVLTVFWDRDTDVLLGAQAAGQEGVDKRLDVMATAIAAQMTIDDLVHLELAYAPPFGSAKDIVNIAGSRPRISVTGWSIPFLNCQTIRMPRLSMFEPRRWLMPIRLRGASIFPCRRCAIISIVLIATNRLLRSVLSARTVISLRVF